MDFARPVVAPTSIGWLGRSCVAAAAALLVSAPATAQTGALPAGPYIEAEGQIVFGGSDFDAGFVPTSIFDVTGPQAKRNEGDGVGGALSFGYGWSSGWRAAVRYRRLDADDTTGAVDPGILVFAAGMDFIPGGFPIGVFGGRTEVSSETSIADLEVGKDIGVGGGQLNIFGGVTYVSIERDVAIECGCDPLAFRLSNDFQGVGPRIGFRGGVPLDGPFSLVGGASVAALFGTSTFASRLDDPLFPEFAFPFKAEDNRTVAALDGHAGVAIAIGPGSLTLGYRVDAMFGALDTDQRVSPLFGSLGFPEIGDKHSDFVEHGPFARLTLPLAAGGN